ncbi:MAG: putative hydrolases of HD superfamily [Parcubacteria group bacterium Gr01-1014_46]|nr:MAG: putative hydrolases of HD superfamily [Parcubacteria group bacterium Gr01-1014_46]
MKKKSSKKSKKETNKSIVNFLFEVGMLAKTPRSGFHFLGTGEQSVAEHLNRTAFIGYALAQMDGTVDVLKVLKMCLFHDLSEARISDLNHIHQKYVERKEHSAVKDISDSVPFGGDMFQTISEYEKRISKEAVLVKDADTLEWVISLKEEIDTGNTRAVEWARIGISKLKTDNAKVLAKSIMDSNSNDWWFPEDSVIRKKKYL